MSDSIFFRVVIVCITLLATAEDASADIEVHYFNCGNECSATIAIDVNNWITITGNIDISQWKSGDLIHVTDSSGDSEYYIYSPLTGRFVPTAPPDDSNSESGVGGGSGGGSGGSGGSGGGGGGGGAGDGGGGGSTGGGTGGGGAWGGGGGGSGGCRTEYYDGEVRLICGRP